MRAAATRRQTALLAFEHHFFVLLRNAYPRLSLLRARLRREPGLNLPAHVPVQVRASVRSHQPDGRAGAAAAAAAARRRRASSRRRAQSSRSHKALRRPGPSTFFPPSSSSSSSSFTTSRRTRTRGVFLSFVSKLLAPPVAVSASPPGLSAREATAALFEPSASAERARLAARGTESRRVRAGKEIARRVCQGRGDAGNHGTVHGELAVAGVGLEAAARVREQAVPRPEAHLPEQVLRRAKLCAASSRRREAKVLSPAKRGPGNDARAAPARPAAASTAAAAAAERRARASRWRCSSRLRVSRS